MPSPPGPRARSSRRTSTRSRWGWRAGPLFGVQFSQLPCSDLSVASPPTMAAWSTRPSGRSGRRSASRLIRAASALQERYPGRRRRRDRRRRLWPRAQQECRRWQRRVDRARRHHRIRRGRAIRGNRIVVDGRGLTFTNASAHEQRPLANSGTVDLAPAGTFPAVTGYYDGGGPLAGQAFGFGNPESCPTQTGGSGPIRPTSWPCMPRRQSLSATAGTDLHRGGEVTEILRSALGVTLAARGRSASPSAASSR